MKPSGIDSLSQNNSDWLAGRLPRAYGPTVLIADDSEADIYFLLRAFSASKVTNPVFVVRSGAETMQYLAGEGKFADRSAYPLPRIVFLDLKMPTPDGLDVLKWKHRFDLGGILWVAMSNFDSVKTINEAYAAGATTFLTKPLDAADVKNLVEAFNDHWSIQDRAATSATLNCAPAAC